MKGDAGGKGGERVVEGGEREAAIVEEVRGKTRETRSERYW